MAKRKKEKKEEKKVPREEWRAEKLNMTITLTSAFANSVNVFCVMKSILVLDVSVFVFVLLISTICETTFDTQHTFWCVKC